MFKKTVRKAAASEEASRTFQYVEPLREARTIPTDFFNILLSIFAETHEEASAGLREQPPRRHPSWPEDLASYAPTT